MPALKIVWLSLNVTFYFPSIIYLIQVMKLKFLFAILLQMCQNLSSAILRIFCLDKQSVLLVRHDFRPTNKIMKQFFPLLPGNRCSPKSIVLTEFGMLEIRFSWGVSINYKSFFFSPNTLSSFLSAILLYVMLKTVELCCFGEARFITFCTGLQGPVFFQF